MLVEHDAFARTEIVYSLPELGDDATPFVSHHRSGRSYPKGVVVQVGSASLAAPTTQQMAGPKIAANDDTTIPQTAR